MQPDDISYFRRRALQEQVAAQKASCEAARKRHDELALIYRFRVMMLSNDRRSGLELVPGKVAEPLV